MGYSQIAGLPAVYGLYGSVFPIILFALFSTSPQFIFGVDAAPAALVGSALLGMNIQSGSKEALASCASDHIFCGIIYGRINSAFAVFQRRVQSLCKFKWICNSPQNIAVTDHGFLVLGNHIRCFQII